MTDSVFLSPKSIAIIGASDKEGSVGLCDYLKHL